MKLDLTIDEVNVIISALAKQPFEQVHGVITKVREQAIPQVEAEQAKEQVPNEEAA